MTRIYDIYDEGGLPGERSRYKNCPEDCNIGCPECWEEEEEEDEVEEEETLQLTSSPN